MAVLIPKPFSKFQKVKKQTQKEPFKIQKSKIILKSKKGRKLTSSNVDIMIPTPFLKFQKVKKQTQKDPFKIQKSKIILKSKKVRKLTPQMWPF